MSERVFINWVEYHGRSAALAKRLNLDIRFFGKRSQPLASKYFHAFSETRHFLKVSKPKTIVVMQPPVPALLACLPYARKHRALLVGDLHTGAIANPKWAWALPLIVGILRKYGMAVVTNDPLAEKLRRKGLKTIVLHDLLQARDEIDQVFDDQALGAATARPYILVPFAFANDEPVSELLHAAREVPEVPLVVTGRAPDEVVASAPGNVLFTGYVSNSDYQVLVSKALGVAALTTRDMTMQRAGYEALEYARPVLTSDFAVLRNYFNRGAVFTRPTSREMAEGIRSLVANAASLSDEMRALRADKFAEQTAGIATLERLLREHEK